LGHGGVSQPLQERNWWAVTIDARLAAPEKKKLGPATAEPYFSPGQAIAVRRTVSRPWGPQAGQNPRPIKQGWRLVRFPVTGARQSESGTFHICSQSKPIRRSAAPHFGVPETGFDDAVFCAGNTWRYGPVPRYTNYFFVGEPAPAAGSLQQKTERQQPQAASARTKAGEQLGVKEA